jgi:hypothetical protein
MYAKIGADVVAGQSDLKRTKADFLVHVYLLGYFLAVRFFPALGSLSRQIHGYQCLLFVRRSTGLLKTC